MIELGGMMGIGEVVALADRRERVSVPAEVTAAVARLHREAAELTERHPTYGRTTGVGANRLAAIRSDDPDYGIRLLRSQAVDTGDPLTTRTVQSASFNCACPAQRSTRRSSTV